MSFAEVTEDFAFFSFSSFSSLILRSLSRACSSATCIILRSLNLWGVGDKEGGNENKKGGAIRDLGNMRPGDGVFSVAQRERIAAFDGVVVAVAVVRKADDGQLRGLLADQVILGKHR